MLKKVCASLLFCASTLFAQDKTVAERLGYPRDAKLLIIHADDLGFSHSADVASFDALDKGAITSASIMMPTPWVTEVAAYARAHPDADLGLHLTLTSEWDTYRWDGLAPTDKVPSLYEPDGTLPNNEETVSKRAKPEEVERELRAQVDRALALGIKPTHLDSHMGALFTSPALFNVYAKVAREYKLPFLAVRRGPLGIGDFALTAKDVPIDAVVIAGGEVARDKWKEFYLDAIRNLKPGITELIVHLGHDDAELQAVTVNHEPYGSAWRQRDYEVMNSAEFKQALRDNKVILIKWRDLQKLVQ
ncbi:MAG TPA: polysaccharide deacetylase family protein [Gemmatimonadaceae bacterium]|nr:polysaccharide deacetylase family protein [Gemmatimonadaceae bacterium]